MLRIASIPALALCLAAGSAGAQTYAVATSFCGGRLIAEEFITQVTPGAQGSASYYVRFFNPGQRPVEYRIQAGGGMIPRPSSLATLASGARTTQLVGSNPNVPGSQPLRNEQLARAVTVSCL
ncbi:hypothetical protein ACE7GA_02160 [Roseomonas sp. CCTCC AB2023176]|uniref:hypothetical protein n=1 Tax=Roseomonas sp. CCTCC AB2023176 TaxID=3342640 RepID=UPI0035E0DFC2